MFHVIKDNFSDGSSLREVNQIALDIRKDLLVKFSQVFFKMTKLINMSERNLEGSYSNKHFVSRNLTLSLAINSVIDS